MCSKEYFVTKYLGPPSDSLIKKPFASMENRHSKPKLILELERLVLDDNNFPFLVYYNYFADIKALHVEWKESLYEKQPTLDDIFEA